jgi:hypothetical protein
MPAARTDSAGPAIRKVALVQHGPRRRVARSADGTTRNGASRREALCRLEDALRD